MSTKDDQSGYLEVCLQCNEEKGYSLVLAGSKTDSNQLKGYRCAKTCPGGKEMTAIKNGISYCIP